MLNAKFQILVACREENKIVEEHTKGVLTVWIVLEFLKKNTQKQSSTMSGFY